MQTESITEKDWKTSQNELKLTLFDMPTAENSYPEDQWGQFSLIFAKKKYKFQPYVLQFS